MSAPHTSISDDYDFLQDVAPTVGVTDRDDSPPPLSTLSLLDFEMGSSGSSPAGSARDSPLHQPYNPVPVTPPPGTRTTSTPWNRRMHASSPRSASPSETFSPPRQTQNTINSYSVAGDEPNYVLPTMPSSPSPSTVDTGPLDQQVDTVLIPRNIQRYEFDTTTLRANPSEDLRARRPWGTHFEYPQPSESDFAWTDAQLFKQGIESDSAVNIDGILQDYSAENKKMEGLLDERTDADVKLSKELRKKNKSAHNLRETLRTEEKLPQSIKEELVAETQSDLFKVEEEIVELKQQRNQRRRELESIILETLGHKRPETAPAGTSHVFARLSKPVSAHGTTPGLVTYPGASNEVTKPIKILVPDWFAVFTTYDIVRLPNNKSSEERFRLLLNIVHDLEQELAEDGDMEGGGSRRGFNKQWHEPSPFWDSPLRRKRGG